MRSWDTNNPMLVQIYCAALSASPPPATGGNLDLERSIKAANTVRASESDKAYAETIAILRAQVAERDRVIGEMAEALAWYGEPVLTYAITQANEPRSAVHADGGKRARYCLASIRARAGEGET